MNSNFLNGNIFKNRTVWMIGLATFLLTVSIAVATHRSKEAAAVAVVVHHGPELIAGPGRVEPFSEDIKIGSELSGRLKSVNVEEGDTIHRGQTLAELENA